MSAVPYDPDQELRGARRELVEQVPPGASVLDVGCWSGFVGRHLLRTRPGVVVDGIEPSSTMAARAAEDYRTVVDAPVEEALSSPALAASYDAVLLLDVLEHLADPHAVLRGLRDRLAPGGLVLASIPNVAHWSVRKQLLLGRWDYADSGLMDRTHLRFFTPRTARALVEDAGFAVRRVTYSLDQPPLVRLPERSLQRLGRFPGLFAVQVLVEGSRG